MYCIRIFQIRPIRKEGEENRKRREEEEILAGLNKTSRKRKRKRKRKRSMSVPDYVVQIYYG